MKIVIVDDNQSFREALSLFLTEELNHKIIGSYESAVDFLADEAVHRADVVIMDLEMPAMDGYTATKKALSHNHYLKIIAVTSYKASLRLDDLIFIGFRGCIFKDAAYNELEIALQELVNNEYYFSKEVISAC